MFVRSLFSFFGVLFFSADAGDEEKKGGSGRVRALSLFQASVGLFVLDGKGAAQVSGGRDEAEKGGGGGLGRRRGGEGKAAGGRR